MWTGSRYNCAQASACGPGQGITVLRLVHVDWVKVHITVLRLVHVDWVKV